MKSVLLTGTVIPVLAAAPVCAQAPIFDWSGFYIGAHGGGLNARSAIREPFDFVNQTVRARGLIGGIQAGYNWQSGNLVLGFEADASLSNAAEDDDIGLVDSRHSAGISRLATLRGRIGLTADRTLFYVTGGAAYGRLEHGLEVGGFGVDLHRGWEWGWVAGLGIEHGLASNWSVRLEVLFAQFPDVTMTSGYTFRLRDSAEIARVAINYRY